MTKLTKPREGADWYELDLYDAAEPYLDAGETLASGEAVRIEYLDPHSKQWEDRTAEVVQADSLTFDGTGTRLRFRLVAPPTPDAQPGGEYRVHGRAVTSSGRTVAGYVPLRIDG